MCNCKKGKKQILNNIESRDHINAAKLIWSDIIEGREVDSFNEMEKSIILQTYSSLYPASKMVPTIDEAIKLIKQAIEIYDVKYRR